MSGSTFSAYAGANVVAVGLGIGYNRYWNTSGNFIGAYGYIGGYVGIPGVATYGGGYQWGNGACTTGWYNTQSLFGFNWRDGSFQGFNLNMNICSYNSNDPNNNATLYTQHGNPLCHSIIDGYFHRQSFSIDWGPKTQFVPGQSNVLPYIFGCPSSNMFDDDQQKGPYNPTELSCVSVSALYQYSCFLNVVQGILPYSVLYSSCSSLAAAAIYSGGMSYLGISPFSLEFLAKNKF